MQTLDLIASPQLVPDALFAPALGFGSLGAGTERVMIATGAQRRVAQHVGT